MRGQWWPDIVTSCVRPGGISGEPETVEWVAHDDPGLGIHQLALPSGPRGLSRFRLKEVLK